MAIGRISGQMLKANLERSGTDLAFETTLLVLDVSAGFVGVGTASPARKLHISDTGALRLPSGTTAQRGTSANGDIRYNTNTSTIEGYAGGAWQNLASGTSIEDADGDTKVDVEHSSDVDEVHVSTGGNQTAIFTTASTQLGVTQLSNTASTVTGLVTNGDITLAPNGTGNVNANADTLRVGDNNADATITTQGTGDLTLSTNSGTDSSVVKILDAANGNIQLTPNGSGEVEVGSGSGNATITSNGAHDLILDTNGGTNSGTITITDGTNGNIAITPNGDGEVDISKVDIDAGAIDGVTIGSNSAATALVANAGINIDDDGDGAIDGCVIGANTAAAGTFTTVTTSGNATVGGNLTVNGTTTTIDSTTLVIEDPLIQLAKNNSGGAANSFDQGLFMNRGSLDNVSILWDESADEFVFAVTSGEDGTTAGNVTIDSYADIQAKDATLNSATFQGLAIEDAQITGSRSNEDITITPAGTGAVVISKLTMSGELSAGDNNITNVGDINVDSVSSDDGDGFDLLLDDNKGNALEIKEGTTAYMNFATTNSSELITVSKNMTIASGVTLATDTADINGGAIDGTTIGAASRAAASVTTLDANDHIDVSADNKSLRVGAGNDLTITHDGTDTTIANTTGILKVDGVATSSIRINEAGANVDTVIEGDSDTALFVVDASADQIGISTSAGSIGYVLDASGSTDAFRVPIGNTAQRPTAATGIIRYNSQTGKYEGCIDGSTYTEFSTAGDTPVISKVSATGDGSSTTFTGFFSSAPAGVSNVLVFIDNVYQEPTENYSVSGSNITFTSAPHNGARIFAIVGFDNTALASGGVARSATSSVAFESTATAILSFNASVFRSAECFITITDSANVEYSSMKAIVIHDGSTAYVSTYGVTNTGSTDLATISADHDGSNTVSLKATTTGGASSAVVQYSLQGV